MDKKAMIKYSLIIASLFILGCGLDAEYIRSKDWQIDSGYRILGADFIDFRDENSLLRLSNDTIFYEGDPVGRITKVSKFWGVITITSMDGKKAGEYIDMDNLLK